MIESIYMQYYRFLLTEDPEWLSSRTDCFSFTDDTGTWLYIPLASEDGAKEILAANPSLSHYEPIELKDYVDWGVQWSTHSPDFRDYMLHVDLSKYTSLQQTFPTLYLKAGPGFGDLSHPTTRLTLAMMAPYVKDKDVIDIGCGSGILTLAAVILGAKSACGIDIDEKALTHAKENAALNGLERQTSFVNVKDYSLNPAGGVVLLMNMIRSHQQEAWSSLPQLHHLPGICISSGVLASEKNAYLKECAKRNWTLLEEQQQGDWMAFRWELQPNNLNP